MKNAFDILFEPSSAPEVPASGPAFGWHWVVSFVVSLIFCLLLSAAGAVTVGSKDAESEIATLAAALQEVAGRGDVTAITDVRAKFESLVVPEDDRDGLGRYRQYYLALADFRAGSIDRKQAVELLDRCVQELEETLDASPDFVEGLVLQAACAGNLISSAPKRALELSMLSQQALQLSKELAPENPRAALVEGLSVMFLPQNFGGGPEKALRLFEESVRRFETGTGRDPIIGWGKDEAYMWLGIALSITGDMDRSLTALQRASDLNPQDSWISQYLIPKVKKGQSLGPVFGLQ